MNKIYVETRVLDQNTSLTDDLIRHVMMRQQEGVTVVVTKKVIGTMSAFAKHWKRLTTAMQNERASTLVAQRIQELNRQTKHMQRLRLVYGAPSHDTPSGVYFSTVQQLTALPAACHTVYLLDDLSQTERKTLQRLMPPQSLLVLYER